jgi:hypothetical protein
LIREGSSVLLGYYVSGCSYESKETIAVVATLCVVESVHQIEDIMLHRAWKICDVAEELETRHACDMTVAAKAKAMIPK